MKKLLFLVIAVFSFALEINFANGVLMKSDLRNRFVDYWSYRANKEFYKTYNFELPYLKYLYSKDSYEDYFNNAPRIKKITVKRIICKENVCFVDLLLHIYKNNVYYKDEWVNVDNVWYHRFNDRGLPF